ncbi:MAG: methylenetetrahydrofolate--tRNA-(uracil(54)-C(5))-methyltransferase (FADH(2)-oxidizing) TrmFO, partial [Pseudomonadota bacterium]
AAGRPVRTRPAYEAQKQMGAVMGLNYGWEHPLWYADAPGAVDTDGFTRQNWWAPVGEECKMLRKSAGIIDISNFAKYRVRGSGAEAWLNALFANNMPKAVGRSCLTPLIGKRGGIAGDFTVTRIAEDEFWIIGSGMAERYHQRFAFIDALLAAEKTAFHEGEDAPYFEGCLPVEVMAERGRETLRYGPLKPVGLTNPHRPEKPYAVVQLRRDNALGTLFNIVGFQTKMRYGAQAEVLRTIPGLEEARFARLGGIHRNTFLNSPRLLDGHMLLRARPDLRFAGQITGVEGYVESAAMGLLAGRMAVAEASGRDLPVPPQTTATGALLAHITGGAEATTFQPMNVNFGLFPPLDGVRSGRRGKRDRALGYTARAKQAWMGWLADAAPGQKVMADLP